MTLSARLAGRALPRVAVPIEVSDPGAALRQRQAEAVEVAERALALHELGGDTGATEAVVEALTAEAERLTAELREHYVDVVLQAVPAPVWEQVMTEFSVEDDETGDWDLSAAALPQMLALCVVADDDDPDLHDPSWWADRLAEWPDGDVLRLRAAVLDVNAPPPYSTLRALGKG